jgi:hypothetical protein
MMIKVKDEIAGLRKEDEKAVASISALRGTLADSRAEVTEIREQIQQIKGSMDSLRRDLSASATRTNKREDEEKGLRDRLDKLTFKINFIENFLGIGRRKQLRGAVEKGEAAGVAAPKEPAARQAIGQDPLRGRVANSSGKEVRKIAEGFESFSSGTPMQIFRQRPVLDRRVLLLRRSTKGDVRRQGRRTSETAKFLRPPETGALIPATGG